MKAQGIEATVNLKQLNGEMKNSQRLSLKSIFRSQIKAGLFRNRKTQTVKTMGIQGKKYFTR